MCQAKRIVNYYRPSPSLVITSGFVHNAHLIRLVPNSVRDITKLSGYPRSNVKTRLEQSNLFLASGRFPLQNAIYDNKLHAS